MNNIHPKKKRKKMPHFWMPVLFHFQCHRKISNFNCAKNVFLHYFDYFYHYPILFVTIFIIFFTIFVIFSPTANYCSFRSLYHYFYFFIFYYQNDIVCAIVRPQFRTQPTPLFLWYFFGILFPFTHYVQDCKIIIEWKTFSSNLFPRKGMEIVGLLTAVKPRCGLMYPIRKTILKQK